MNGGRGILHPDLMLSEYRALLHTMRSMLLEMRSTIGRIHRLSASAHGRLSDALRRRKLLLQTMARMDALKSQLGESGGAAFGLSGLPSPSDLPSPRVPPEAQRVHALQGYKQLVNNSAVDNLALEISALRRGTPPSPGLAVDPGSQGSPGLPTAPRIACSSRLKAALRGNQQQREALL